MCCGDDRRSLVAEAQAPSDQLTRFPAGVEEVLVDVVVGDRDGSAVGGLTRDDFLLAEDGVPQTLVSFEAVEVAPGGAARDPLEPPPTVSANPVAGGSTPRRRAGCTGWCASRSTARRRGSVRGSEPALPLEEAERLDAALRLVGPVLLQYARPAR